MAATTYIALNNVKFQAGPKNGDGKAETREALAGDEFTVDSKYVQDLLDKGRIKKAAREEPEADKKPAK